MTGETLARRAVLLLAVVVCLSGMTAGTAAAANVTITNPTEGEVGDHTWNTTVSSDGTLEHLVINYTGTGANLTELNATISQDQITVADTTVAINGTQYSRTSTTVNATLESSVEVSNGDRIEFLFKSVRNPSATGTATASIELNNSSGTFTSSTESFDIVQGGYVNGTIENGTGAGLSTGSVTVRNDSTGVFVANFNVDPSTGQYEAHIPDGTYTFRYDATDYAADSRTIEINTSESKSVNETLAKKGYINGTVTDRDGNALGGITLVADEKGGTDQPETTTAADGSFSLYVGPGAYDLVAVDNPDYTFEIEPDVSVQSDTTTTADLTLSAVPDKGTITGRLVDADGNGVSGKKIIAGDASYQYRNTTLTNATGHFSMKVPEATYRLRATSSPTTRLSDVSVTAGEASSVELTVPERAYLDGQISNATGPIPKATVVASSGDDLYVNKSTDVNGNYNITVPSGEYSITVFVPGQTAGSKRATVTAGSTNTTDITLKQTAVTSRSVSIVDGPGTETDLGTRAAVRNGLIQIQVVNETTAPPNLGAPQELETMGVTDDTKFEINLTVTNFSADSLLWAIDDAEFSTTQSTENSDATNITIRGNATTLQANLSSAGVGPLLDRDPSDVQWPTDRADRASVGVNQTVFIGVLNFDSTPGEIEESLNGASVTTNAQQFSAPSVRNETLRIWIGAPSKTVGGTDHTGFYQATIPDSQLDAWGVDDPESELRTFYKGAQTDFTVEETTGGARIRLDNISYSAGFVAVEADPSADSSGGGGGGDGSDDGPEPSTAASVAGDSVRLSVDNVRSGTPVTVDVPNSPAMDRTGVRMRAVELTLTFSGDSSLDIDTADAPSQPTPDGTEALFAYDVSTDLSDADIDRATVRLTVDSTRVSDPESVRALRRTDDGWEPVPTTFVGTADGEYAYAVETTEFSEFAVVEEARSASTATATEEPTATPTATATEEPTSVPTTTTAATPTADPTTTSTTQPGFGVVVAVAALLVSAILARRR